MTEVLNFFTEIISSLSERGKGFILTMMGAGTGLAPEVLQESARATTELHPLQKAVLYLTAVVTLMTIISYGYKFYKWIRQCF